jgi:hypothetical protein
MVGPRHARYMSMSRDRGAVAIIVGVGAVFLLGIAAIAVDLGNGWAERRHVQNGADLAALAGAVEVAIGGDAQAAVDEILTSVDTNVRPLAASDWLPSNCTDADELVRTAAELGLTPASECISFNYDFSEVRVRIPPQTMDTSFAPVIGVQALTLNASANAGGQTGNPPPFAVLDGFEAGDEACLRTSSNIVPGETWNGNGPGTVPSAVALSTDPCDSTALDISSQYMGTLDPPIWFDDAGNVICKSNEIAYLIAGGIDHRLARFIDTPSPGTSPRFGAGGYGTPDSRAVEDACGPIPTERPNTIPLTTGTTSSLLRCGLLTARSGNCGSAVPGPTGRAAVPARLHQGDYVQGTYLFVGEQFDNEPLWNFIRSDIASVSAPAACSTVYANRSNGTWDYYDKHDEMVECLNRWKDTAYDPIFNEDIAEGARFMFAPLLAESSLDTSDPDAPTACTTSTAPRCVHIDDWVPVYIQTLYVASNGLSSDCDPNGVDVGRHHAGQEFSCGANNKNVDAASAMVLGCGMLPSTVCVPRSGGTSHDPGGNPVPAIQLTK